MFRFIGGAVGFWLNRGNGVIGVFLGAGLGAFLGAILDGILSTALNGGKARGPGK